MHAENMRRQCQINTRSSVSIVHFKQVIAGRMRLWVILFVSRFPGGCFLIISFCNCLNVSKNKGTKTKLKCYICTVKCDVLQTLNFKSSTVQKFKTSKVKLLPRNTSSFTIEIVLQIISYLKNVLSDTWSLYRLKLL